jgi:hypothetical protein
MALVPLVVNSTAKFTKSTRTKRWPISSFPEVCFTGVPQRSTLSTVDVVVGMVEGTMKSIYLITVVTALLLSSAAAQADLSISNKPTRNMSCVSGVCTATAKGANLNVTNLTNMLAAGDTTVKFGGGALAIQVIDSFSWTSTNRLILDANTSVGFHSPVSVAGSGALTLTYNDGGTDGDLKFFGKGKVDFSDLNSNLTINGNSYTLVGNIQTLASDIAVNPSGYYALANNYDAVADGHYVHPPIAGAFGGILEGLNNKIENLTVHAIDEAENAGLFGRIEFNNAPLLRDIQLVNVDVSSAQEDAGALAGDAIGALIFRCYSSGKVNGYVNVGGLVGFEYGGTIIGSGSSVAVRETGGRPAGGLVGWARESNTIESFAIGPVTGGAAGGLTGQNTGTIERSYASGTVTGSTGRYTFAGGLAGLNDLEGFSEIHDSYATGAVMNHGKYFTGGLVGYSAKWKGDQSPTLVATSYSIGQVQGGNSKRVGGFAGEVDGDGVQHDYWNVTTSGTSQGVGKGCGKEICQANVIGLTDDQLKSALPKGFDPKIWGQAPGINNGYPYLLANPPPK